MAYKLRNDLWFCQSSDHLIFLDTHQDRYFRLPPAMEHAYLRYLQGDPAADVAALLDQSLVARMRLTDSPAQPCAIQPPARSALEQAPNAPGLRLAPLLDVSAAVASALLRLKTRPLNEALAGMARDRQRHTTAATQRVHRATATELVDAARAFNRVRLYVPVAPTCLLDSIALALFLARRRLHAMVVFGVIGIPFSAHSWVQSGDMVLNDTVGNANAYTPIGVF
ncbi:lasso peptide biosynthesis B2 protein [Xanthomonas campestris pv. phormiicola]|nr:lasso peptide biosynthesis B2 protein [Xanthomonas campestris pv. phormiicola]UYC15965.1 lasso peptide biosynthesis B2 protein [Xanthomonas campestris pv. phormiicola]